MSKAETLFNREWTILRWFRVHAWLFQETPSPRTWGGSVAVGPFSVRFMLYRHRSAGKTYRWVLNTSSHLDWWR